MNLLNYLNVRVSRCLKMGILKRKGKNFSGKICVFHRGGGNKRFYRVVDFFRRLDAQGFICSVYFDPNRSAFIGLVLYDIGFFSYIVLSEGSVTGQKIFSGISSNNFFLGKSSATVISNLALFGVISNIETKPKFGAALSRAAGAGAVIVASGTSFLTLKLKSGWLVRVSINSLASIGYVSNILHMTRVLGKAGKNRVFGKRPVVRGVAMNPCDHPHGGGNGKTSPPAAPVSPWGRITKWTHTKNKKTDRLKRSLFKVR